MKILQESYMPLLSRKDYTIELEYAGSTPNKEDVKKKLAVLLKEDETLIVLKHIYPRYGELKVNIIASVYKDVESLNKIEKVNKKAKTKDGKEKGKKQEAK